jgi:hypothetical protein
MKNEMLPATGMAIGFAVVFALIMAYKSGQSSCTATPPQLTP